MAQASAQLRSEFAPTGTLRVANNMSNFLLTRKDPVSGEAAGVAIDMGKELARRLGVPVQILQYDSPGKVADDANKGVWDVGFIGAEPQRANEMDFSAAYVEIEATYLVPPGSPIQSIDEVDRPGARIAISERSAYDLYLTRTLKHAELVRVRGGDEVFKRFVDDKLTALVD
jgi:polar amino acid transport system substrate-binding protein